MEPPQPQPQPQPRCETTSALGKFILELEASKCEDFRLVADERRRGRLSEIIRQKCAPPAMDLSNVGLGSRGAAAVAKFLSHSDQEDAYTSLSLAGNAIGDAGTVFIAEFFFAATQHSSASLTSLDLSGCDISARGLERLFEALHDSTTLTALNVSSSSGGSRNRLGSRGTAALARCLSASGRIRSVLTRLEMADSSPDQLELLVSSLASGTELSHIDLSADGVTDASLEPLLSGTGGLLPTEVLLLGHNWIGVKGGAAIAKLIGRSPLLRELNLSHNRLGAAGAKAIAQSLHGSSTISVLHIDSNSIGSQGFEAFIELYPVLPSFQQAKRNRPMSSAAATTASEEIPPQIQEQQVILQRSLRVLTISDNTLDPQAGSFLAQLVARCPVLEFVDVSANSLGDVGISALAVTLASPTCTVRTLKVAQNNFGEFACKGIATALATNRFLRRLDISQNREVGSAGVDAITRALDRNSRILFVNTDFCRVGYKSHDALSRKLRHNRAVQARKAMLNVERQVGRLKGSREWLDDLKQRSDVAHSNLNLLQGKLSTIRGELAATQEETSAETAGILAMLEERTTGIADICSAEAKARSDIENTRMQRESTIKSLLARLHREKDELESATRRAEDAERRLAELLQRSREERARLEADLATESMQRKAARLAVVSLGAELARLRS